MKFRLAAASLAAAFVVCVSPALAQMGPGGPPAVGVVKAKPEPIYQSDQFVGRIEAEQRVTLAARVNGVLEKRLFTEGDEVKKNQLLFVLEQPPYQAAVRQQQAAVAEAQANVQNANITLSRARRLMGTPAGQQSNVDNALATQLADAAKVMSAQAQLETAQINLGYTEIRAPISGRIGLSKFSVGNVVGSSSGALATIVSQDPMYVSFPISVRTALELRQRYAGQGGFNSVLIKVRLPDGQMYNQTGKLDFVDTSVSTNTDTILLRGTIPNPVLPGAKSGAVGDRALTDGEFVTVILQGVKPVEQLTVPRAAVLSDQQGDYVLVVNAKNQVERRPITLGQSTPATAVIASGLKAGEEVIVNGVQKVRPGITVKPGPASPAPGTAPAAAGK
ncbi:MAG TPA: efflux RND transporter periplasmic adaptor subunit [Acetobacteraceae bacterium]|nr:efflux RND transporter periplasmic adaptor subunit [Acetobacteraceae bacterium]